MKPTPRIAILKCVGMTLAIAAFSAIADDALAHARVKRANPPVGGTIAASAVPAEIQVWFSERVEPAFSTILVVNSAGTRMDRGAVRADAGDNTQLRVALQPLAPGLYRVIWRVVSADTHTTNGSFPFRVRARSRPRLGQGN